MNFNNFTIKSQEAVQKAVELVQSNGQQVVETPHLLKGLMLTGEDVLQFLFGKTGVNVAMLSSVIDNMIAGFPKVSGGDGHLNTLHIWWSRKPLGVCRAVAAASLWPDPCDNNCPEKFITEAKLILLEIADNFLHLLSQQSFKR